MLSQLNDVFILNLNGTCKLTYQKIDVVILIFEVLHQLLEAHSL